MRYAGYRTGLKETFSEIKRKKPLMSELVNPPIAYSDKDNFGGQGNFVTLGHLRNQLAQLEQQRQGIHPDFVAVVIIQALCRISPELSRNGLLDKLTYAYTTNELDGLRIIPTDVTRAVAALNRHNHRPK